MRKQISRSQIKNKLKINRQVQPEINLDLLVKTTACIELPHEEFPTPKWFENKSTSDVTIIIPIAEFNSATIKSIDLFPYKQKNSLNIFYLNYGKDDIAVNIIKSWDNRKLKRSIGRIFNVKHIGSILKSLIKEVKSEVVSFLQPESLPDNYWITDLAKSNNTCPLLLWRDKVFDECIYSAGVDWHNNKFVHIGRDLWKGTLMPTPHHISNLPSEYNKLNQHTLNDWNGLTIKKECMDLFDKNYNSLSAMLTDYTTKYEIAILNSSIITVCNPYVLCESTDLARYYNKWIVSGKLNGNKPKRILIKKLHTRIREAGIAACKLKNKDNIIIFFTNKPEELHVLPIDRIVTNEELVSNRTFQVYYDLDGQDSFDQTLGLID